MAAARSAAAQGRAKVTFLGFQRFEDDSSRLFVHMTEQPTAVRKQQDDVRVSVLLVDAEMGVRNNLNPLVFEHFQVTPLRAQLKSTSEGVVLEIVLRKPDTVRHRVVARADAGYSLQLDFSPLAAS